MALAPSCLGPRLALSVCLFLGGVAAASGCAHGPSGASLLESIDYLNERGERRTLSQHLGKVIVLDLCAAALDPCLYNAKAVSESCDALCAKGAFMMTILFDDVGGQAPTSYRKVLKLRQEVTEAGPRLRGGDSGLGPIAGLPRTILIDREGRVVEDVAGQNIQGVILSERVSDAL